MSTTALSRTGAWWVGLGLALLAPVWPSPLGAQEPRPWDREPVLPPQAALVPPAEPAPAPAGPRRIRLFRIQPGFLSDPVGLEEDDSPPGVSPASPGAPAPPPAAAEEDPGPDWIQLNAGADNPYFDLRQRGDPGGLGFYKVWTQVRLFESDSAACAVGLQAVTPAGLEFAGVETGPTVLSPSLCLFRALDDGTALQGFVGKNLPVGSAAASGALQRKLQYGVALQRALAADGPDRLRNLYLYLGALGQSRTERDTAHAPAGVEVLPGLHWKVADNWWLSGGVILPVGAPRSEPGLWQFTCSLQF